MTTKKEKQKQMRRTFDDVIKYQSMLRSIVKKKIETEEVLSKTEIDRWDRICGYALFKYGNLEDAYIDRPDARIPLGKVHSFALHFVDYGKTVEITFRGRVFIFPIVFLWKLLYRYFDDVFPASQEAAFYISNEEREQEDWSGYQFNVNKKIR